MSAQFNSQILKRHTRTHLIAVISLVVVFCVTITTGQQKKSAAPSAPATSQQKKVTPTSAPTRPTPAGTPPTPLRWVPVVLPIGAQGIQELAADVRNPSKLYATTREGLLMTDSGGSFWETSFYHPATANAMQSDRWMFAQSKSSPNVLFLGGSWWDHRAGGVWKSDTGGRSWSPIGSGVIDSVDLVALDSSDSNVVYVSCSKIPGNRFSLLKSLNGGKTWGNITPGSGPFYSLSANPDTPQEILVVQQGGWVFRTQDGGLSWQRWSPKLPVQIHPWGRQQAVRVLDQWDYIAFHPGNSKVMIALGTAGYPMISPRCLLVSKDSGDTWTEVSIQHTDPLLTGAFATAVAQIDHYWFVQGSSEQLYVSTPIGLFATGDLGANWCKVLDQDKHRSSPVLRTADKKLVTTIVNEGLSASMDGGKTWYRTDFGISASAPIGEFLSGDQSRFQMLEGVDPETGTAYLGGYGGYWTSHDLFHWEKHTTGTGGNVRQIIPMKDGTVYVGSVTRGGFSAKVIKADGTPAPDFKLSTTPCRMAASRSDPMTVYVSARDDRWPCSSGTDGVVLYKSEDRGFSWQTMDYGKWVRRQLIGYTPPAIQVLQVPAESPRDVYMLVEGSNGSAARFERAIIMSHDGGLTWSEGTPAILGALRGAVPNANAGRIVSLTVDEVSPKVVIVGFENAVAVSVDGGNTWRGRLVPVRVVDVRLAERNPIRFHVIADTGIHNIPLIGPDLRGETSIVSDVSFTSLFQGPSGFWVQGSSGVIYKSVTPAQMGEYGKLWETTMRPGSGETGPCQLK